MVEFNPVGMAGRNAQPDAVTLSKVETFSMLVFREHTANPTKSWLAKIPLFNGTLADYIGLKTRRTDFVSIVTVLKRFNRPLPSSPDSPAKIAWR